MLTKKIAAFIVVAGLLVGGTAMAWDYGWSESPVGRISTITVLKGGFEVKLKDSPSLCGEATRKDLARFFEGQVVGGITLKQEDVNRMLSAAMMAYVSGKSVKIYTDNNPGGWACKAGLIYING